MYKVCILDDQPFVREGLRSLIDWKSLGCEIVAEWETGVVVIRELDQVQPDIIISDIVMPGMDGLTLIEMLNQSGRSIKVIFLSAHRNFEYAHKAIALGAIDYLVKPTDPNEVIRAVMKCIQRLVADENASVSDKGTLSDHRQKVLRNLLLQLSEERNGSIDDRLYYAVMSIRMESDEPSTAKLHESAEMLRQKMGGVYPPDIMIILDMLTVVVCAKEEATLLKHLVDWAEEIQFWHRQLLDVTASIGISSISQGTINLHEQYLQSKDIFRMTFYYGPGSILNYLDCIESDSNKLPSHFYNDVDKREEELLSRLRQGDDQQILVLLEGWFVEFKSNQWSEVDLKYQVCKWLFYIFHEMQLTSEDKVYCETQAKEILVSKSIDAIKGLVWSIISYILNQYKMSVTDHHHQIIQSVEYYIKHNYSNAEASLTTLAEQVHLTPNYVSRLIKRRMGRSFTEWLNEHRLEEAKRLLQNKDNKSYWVAEKVGIPDARYFSQLFRKYTNVTPTEFKNQQPANGSREL